MTSPAIRFDDGAAYERYMGVWSQSAAELFWDWLNLPTGRACLDIGCGNGASTVKLVQRCAPSEVAALDPSAEQLAYARQRETLASVDFRQGDAMALPWADDRFQCAVMSLVLFFVPRPEQAVAEMVRVLQPGGVAAAYVWNLPGGGFPYAPVQDVLRDLGYPVPLPPSANISAMSPLLETWHQAGLVEVQSRQLEVERHFAHVDEFWETVQLTSSMGDILRQCSASQLQELKKRVSDRLPVNRDGSLTCQARANAISGKVGAVHPLL